MFIGQGKMRNRSYRRNQMGLATWLKWVIGLVVGGMLLSMAACGLILFGGYTMMKGMTDPVAVKQNMNKIADIDISSDRYQPNLGLDLPPLGLVISSVTDSQTKLSWAMVKVPNNDEKQQTNEQMLAEFAESGVPTATTTGQGTMKVGITSKGTVKVAGQEMAYILGTTNSEQGVQPVYLALTLPTPKQVDMVCAIGEAGKEIDLKQVNEFLAKIKAFK